MYRILYLSPGPSPYSTVPTKNQFFFLSTLATGDLLSPIWGKKADSEIETTIPKVDKAMGNFKYHVTFSFGYPWIIRLCWDILFYISVGLFLYYFKNKYDVIITYGPYKTAMAGYLLKKLTNAKLIIEIPGNPKKAFLYENHTSNISDRIKSKLGDTITRFILNRADHLKLLYPTQLQAYKIPKKGKISVFHDFVPISQIKTQKRTEKYILFLGFPWFLKGVDVLIKAFNKISAEFSLYQLRIVGFCPQKSYFQNLALGNQKIQLSDPVWHEEALKLISNCTVLVLPSRTEGMGRVLLEAMAAQKPVIASNVDGIPYHVKDGYNGLLFESENENDLANKIKSILKNKKYARRLGSNGYHYVHNYFSEEKYIENYKRMIERTLRPIPDTNNV